jgi:hypothetical protein
LQATTTIGYRGRTLDALPLEDFIRICKRHRVIGDDVQWPSLRNE